MESLFNNKRRKKMDTHGQMIVLEVIFFSSMVLLSLVFIYQLTPTSLVSRVSSNDLQIKGDDALRSLYSEQITVQTPPGYPTSQLIHYLITNSYGDLIADIQNLLPSSVMFNLYISNTTTTILWCTSQGGWTQPIPTVDPVSNCHCYIALDPAFEDIAVSKGWYDYIPNDQQRETVDSCDIFDLFEDDAGDDTQSRTFLLTLEIWYV